jgi:hypothetical protein
MTVSFIPRCNFYSTNSSSQLTSNISPIEQPDGIRTIFTTPDVYIPGSLMIYINGLYEFKAIPLGNHQFMIDNPPLSSTDEIRLVYIPA